MGYLVSRGVLNARNFPPIRLPAFRGQWSHRGGMGPGPELPLPRDDDECILGADNELRLWAWSYAKSRKVMMIVTTESFSSTFLYEENKCFRKYVKDQILLFRLLIGLANIVLKVNLILKLFTGKISTLLDTFLSSHLSILSFSKHKWTDSNQC